MIPFVLLSTSVSWGGDGRAKEFNECVIKKMNNAKSDKVAQSLRPCIVALCRAEYPYCDKKHSKSYLKKIKSAYDRAKAVEDIPAINALSRRYHEIKNGMNKYSFKNKSWWKFW